MWRADTDAALQAQAVPHVDVPPVRPLRPLPYDRPARAAIAADSAEASDPNLIVHVPRRWPPTAGFWVRNNQSDELLFVDAGPEAAVHTRWPVVDRFGARVVEHAADQVLNAAADNPERLAATLAGPQSEYWRRVAEAGSLGAQAQLFMGDGIDGSHAGLIIDDSDDDTIVDRWPDRATPGTGTLGFGGPGAGARRIARTGDPGGGGGSYGTQGSSGSSGTTWVGGEAGVLVPPEHSLAAIRARSWTKELLGMGGSGGDGVRLNPSGSAQTAQGGHSGHGFIRASSGSLTESTPTTNFKINDIGTGNDGSSNGGLGGGGGSGGLYLALVALAYVLDVPTIDCGGGSGPGNAGNGGNGRMIVLYGDTATIPPSQVTNAVLTTYQMLPAIPRGGLIVSFP